MENQNRLEETMSRLDGIHILIDAFFNFSEATGASLVQQAEASRAIFLSCVNHMSKNVQEEYVNELDAQKNDFKAMFSELFDNANEQNQVNTGDNTSINDKTVDKSF